MIHIQSSPLTPVLGIIFINDFCTSKSYQLEKNCSHKLELMHFSHLSSSLKYQNFVNSQHYLVDRENREVHQVWILHISSRLISWSRLNFFLPFNKNWEREKIEVIIKHVGIFYNFSFYCSRLVPILGDRHFLLQITISLSFSHMTSSYDLGNPSIGSGLSHIK